MDSAPANNHRRRLYFNFDRPHVGEGAAALPAAATSEGKANFDALVINLKADPTPKVQLIGRASPEARVGQISVSVICLHASSRKSEYATGAAIPIYPSG